MEPLIGLESMLIVIITISIMVKQAGRYSARVDSTRDWRLQ